MLLCCCSAAALLLLCRCHHQEVAADRDAWHREAFLFQIDNGIPIESWFDDADDTGLLALMPFLESLAVAEDVRPPIRKMFSLHDYGLYG